MSYQQAGVLDNVPLYVEAKTLAILIMRAIPSFPKAYKYTIGNEIQKSAIRVMRNIALAVHASSGEERLRAVALHQAEFELLKGYLDIAFEMKCFGGDVFGKMTKHVLSIGRQSTAWKRSLEKGCGQNRQGQG